MANRGMFGYEGEGFIMRDSDAGFRSNEDSNIGRPSFRGRGPKNYRRSDDRIREDVCEWLEMDHDVDASDIEVTVKEGTVQLTGTVSDRFAKRRAEDIADSIRGVRDVDNQLRVNRG